MVHITVDLAAYNNTFVEEGSSLPGVHRAVHNNLYAGSEADRKANWAEYIVMLGRHTRAMIDKAGVTLVAARSVRDKELADLPDYMQEKVKLDYPEAYAD